MGILLPFVSNFFDSPSKMTFRGIEAARRHRFRVRRLFQLSAIVVFALVLLSRPFNVSPFGNPLRDLDNKPEPRLAERHNLAKRDPAFDAAVAKGEGLVCDMDALTAADAGVSFKNNQVDSKWTDYQSLSDWGWELYEGDFGNPTDHHLDDALNFVGVNPDSIMWSQYNQDEVIRVGGVTYEVCMRISYILFDVWSYVLDG